VIAADAGRYANSIEWKSGVEVRGDRNSESQMRDQALKSWLLQERTLKGVVEEATGRDLVGREA
jgi:hypothetical protein